jgi:hypothetical protein
VAKLNIDRVLKQLDPAALEAEAASLRDRLAKLERLVKMRREIEQMVGPGGDGAAAAARPAGKLTDAAADYLRKHGPARAAAIAEAAGTTRGAMSAAMRKEPKRFRLSGRGRSATWSLK